MAGVPIDQRSKLRGQDHYWAVIRELAESRGVFTARDVAEETNAPTASVREYIVRLARGGYLAQEGTRGQAKLYVRIKDQRMAPRLRKDGTLVTQGGSRELMWRTMKMLKVFTARELAVAAGTGDRVVELEDAKNYLKFLNKAGYVTVIEGGFRGTPATYRFLRNTGPLPPKVQRVQQVYDPNTGEVVWNGGGHERS